MQRCLCDVKHLRTVDTAIVIHLLDDESIGEGWDVQHVQQCGLTGTNLVASLDQIDITLGIEGDRNEFTFINNKSVPFNKYLIILWYMQ